MPKTARPTSRAQVEIEQIRLRREFRDLANRPLLGNVRITGTKVTRTGSSVVVPETATVALVNGVLDVMLPPDTYQLVGDFYTADRVASEYSESVTLGGPE
jgi:hypothetical protein